VEEAKVDLIKEETPESVAAAGLKSISLTSPFAFPFQSGRSNCLISTSY